MFIFDSGNGHRQRFLKYTDAKSALETYVGNNCGAFDEDVSDAKIFIECAELEPNIVDDGYGGIRQSGWNICENTAWKYRHRSDQISVQERNAMMAKLTALGLVDIDDKADSDGNHYFKWTETGKRLCTGIADDPQEPELDHCSRCGEPVAAGDEVMGSVGGVMHSRCFESKVQK